MKNYRLLTRVMVRNMLASMNPMNGIYADGKKRKKAVVRAALLALLALYAVGVVIFLEYQIYRGLSAMHQPLLLPGLAVMASMMFTLVLGLFQGMSELFQGKDAPFLAVLPLTSRQVFAARMTVMYLSELALDALLCVPAFVLFAIGRGTAWPYVLTGLPVLLFLPLIPLSVMALVSSLLMRISFVSRHRETLVMLLSVLLALAYSTGVTLTSSSNMSGEEMAAVFLRENGLAAQFLDRFPPALWAARGFTGDAGLLLLFAGVSAACAAVVIALAGPGYLNLALSGGEQTVTHGRKRGAYRWSSSSGFRALHTLEWREMLRTPSWAVNSLMGLLMFPLMLGVGLFSGIRSAGDSAEGLRSLLASVDPGYVALVCTGVILLGAWVNPAVATAVSREGGRLPFALTLPVRQETRFRAKLAVGAEINLACMILITVMLWFILRFSPLWLLAAFAVAALSGTADAALSLRFDAAHPHLNWNTETEAIKKNYNSVFGMLIWLLLTVLCGVPGALLWNLGGTAVMLSAFAVAAAECAVSLLLLQRAARRPIPLQES